MAKYQSSPFFLAKGESLILTTTFNPSADIDVGAVFFLADPRTNLGWYPESGNAGFETSNFQMWSWYSPYTGFSYFNYKCVVTNVGDINTSFVLNFVSFS